MTRRGCCALCSRNDFLFSRSFSVGCTWPLTSVTRETTVCSPGVAPFQSKWNSFHEYLLFCLSHVAACHGPSSTFTSTDFIGVPSFSATPTTLWVSPSLVMRATYDLSCRWVTALSIHFISPLIISPRTVRYQRAWYLPRYGSCWATMSDSHLTLATPYQ